jgi:pyrroline-5-carboxylate reductase
VLNANTIGFLGAGSMAEALIGGVVQGGVVEPGRILVTNRSNQERLISLARKFGVRITHSKAALVDEADILVIACKPKDVIALLTEVGPFTYAGQVILSVVAGVSTETIQAYCVNGVQVVRAMPNTSCQVGESATAISAGAGAAQQAVDKCRAILGAVGQIVEVPEALIDSVTGLSGSGPAYVYLMLEAMIEAGQAVGLSEAVARTLAIQTFKGAAKMVIETGIDPATLRQKVTSPGGTTMAGLQVLDEAGFRQAVVKAVASATQRSRELGALVRPAIATGS